MKKTFWDRTAKSYDHFMKKDHKAYKQMYSLIYPVVRHKQVLELATGTGLIAKHIVRSADHIEATDASQEMIEQAKQGVKSTKLYFSVQDMFHLPYADQSFDVVIVVNALHIVPEPEKALSEIRRVLKPGGTFLICNESNGDSDKDEKWTEIIGGMTIYSGDELKTFLENDGFCSKRCPIRRCRAAGGGVNNSCSTVCCPRFAVFAEFCSRSHGLCGSGRTDS